MQCPFIAARAISRSGDGLPGKGFFDLARSLSRGPEAHESDRAFHARELNLVTRQSAEAGAVSTV